MLLTKSVDEITPWINGAFVGNAWGGGAHVEVLGSAARAPKLTKRFQVPVWYRVPTTDNQSSLQTPLNWWRDLDIRVVAPVQVFRAEVGNNSQRLNFTVTTVTRHTSYGHTSITHGGPDQLNRLSAQIVKKANKEVRSMNQILTSEAPKSYTPRVESLAACVDCT